jgi:phosphatidylserine decarboxylase
MSDSRLKIQLFRLLPKGFISRVFGYMSLIYFPSAIMKRIITWYSTKYGVNLDEAEIPSGGFKNLNSFFTRKLKKDARKIDAAEKTITSPTDSRVDRFGDIKKDIILQAKGIDYSLYELIPSAEAEKFVDGKYITLYLSPGDYHRIHSPVTGQITGFFNIPGKLYTVQDFMVKGFKGLFSVNERLITYIQTSKGVVAVCKIGAMNVGKISLSYNNCVTNRFFRRKNEFFYPADKRPVINKGDEVGTFNLGSTVILLFQKNMIKFEKLKEGQKIKVGEKIAVLS